MLIWNSGPVDQPAATKEIVNKQSRKHLSKWMRLARHHQSSLTLPRHKNSRARLINRKLKARENKTSIIQTLFLFFLLRKEKQQWI